MPGEDFDERLDGSAQPEEDIPPPEQINDAMQAPTIYADGLLFASRMGGTVRLQFAEYVPQASNANSPGLKTRHILNVVMSLEGYESMVRYMEDVNDKFILPKGSADGD